MLHWLSDFTGVDKNACDYFVEPTEISIQQLRYLSSDKSSLILLKGGGWHHCYIVGNGCIANAAKHPNTVAHNMHGDIYVGWGCCLQRSRVRQGPRGAEEISTDL